MQRFLVFVHGTHWIVYGYLLGVFFLLSSRLRLSSVSVVFDFNASLNDVAPLSPKKLTLNQKKKKKKKKKKNKKKKKKV